MGNRNTRGFMVGDRRSPDRDKVSTGMEKHGFFKKKWMCCRGTKVPVDFWTGVRNSYGSCLGNQTFLCSVSTAMQRSCGSGPANLGCCRAPRAKKDTRTILFGARIRQWPDMASLSHHVRASPGFNAAHRVAPGDADGGTAARTAHTRGVEVVLNASDANTLFTESSFFAMLVNGESVRPPLVTAHRTVRPRSPATHPQYFFYLWKQFPGDYGPLPEIHRDFSSPQHIHGIIILLWNCCRQKKKGVGILW